MRCFDHPTRKDIQYQRRPGIYAVIRRGTDLLVTEQTTDTTEVQLPGGGIDPGEQPIAALYRECLEETGWSIQVESRLGVYRRFVYMPDYDMWAEKICHIYLARPGQRIGPPTEPGHRALFLPWQVATNAFPDAGSAWFAGMAMRSGAKRCLS